MENPFKMPNFVKNLFKSDSSVSEQEMITLREAKVQLIKSEITDIIEKIDLGEETFTSELGILTSEIEKGLDGKVLEERMIQRHEQSETDLLKAMQQKKIELHTHEVRLKNLKNTLEKGKPASSYADSIVKDDTGAILMLLRKNGDKFEPNKWGLPGGHIEPGEDPATAAKRELLEESHLIADSCHKVAERTLPDGGKIHFYDIYLGITEEWIALDDDEHSNYCFMSLNELRQRPNSDFVLDLKDILLEIVDPLYEHFKVIRKGYDEGQIDDDTFTKAMESREGFQFQSKPTE